MHRFLIIIEKAENNYSAYSPDLEGCIATGKTREKAEENIYRRKNTQLGPGENTGYGNRRKNRLAAGG